MRPRAPRDRIDAICAALPGVTAEEAGRHVRYVVRGRTVAWFMDDHHGDGRVSLCVKAGPGGAEAMVAADPDHRWVPAYIGRHGWVACALDLPDVDWVDIAELVTDSYRIIAPARLVSLLP
ncbi:MmcQ/YjbR family DNA-binding protein [Miltoncostaea oceani]|uniref:MmcQ/YjbR family DNA-binding protein n=1 Tax=Miltoncostaea oceani TaxID=2843216 RepID=UPI001C3E3A79|nr:MmcQ/YjbR family DNA-binding protein [Miltoncostaea oceani]